MDSEDDVSVVGEASDGASAVDAVRRTQPDIALLDIEMQIVNGLDGTRTITRDPQLGQVSVVILTSYDLGHHVYTALRNGAAGFLVKDAQPTELLHALRVVAAGDALLSPGVTRRLIEAFVTH